MLGYQKQEKEAVKNLFSKQLLCERFVFSRSATRRQPPSSSVALEAQPTKVAGTLRRAVRVSAFTAILGGRHMECAYYFDFFRLFRRRPFGRWTFW